MENYKLLLDSVVEEKKSYFNLLETNQKNVELSSRISFTIFTIKA